MRITVPMYEKGRSFIMAGGLVKAYEGHKFVYLHLLCQGFENIGKAMLLAEDYEKYGPLLKKPFGHDLKTLLDELIVIYGDDFLSQSAYAEIEEINNFYKLQQLRYGDDLDFFSIDASFNLDNLYGELVANLESLNRKFELIANCE